VAEKLYALLGTPALGKARLPQLQPIVDNMPMGIHKAG
jgi:hypothetical protein